MQAPLTSPADHWTDAAQLVLCQARPHMAYFYLTCQVRCVMRSGPALAGLPAAWSDSGLFVLQVEDNAAELAALGLPVGFGKPTVSSCMHSMSAVTVLHWPTPLIMMAQQVPLRTI
jgi:hypothetical protein